MINVQNPEIGVFVDFLIDFFLLYILLDPYCEVDWFYKSEGDKIVSNKSWLVRFVLGLFFCIILLDPFLSKENCCKTAAYRSTAGTFAFATFMIKSVKLVSFAHPHAGT
jgi:hypothetical protein